MAKGKKFILLIEDDQTLAKMYQIKLEKEGFKVAIAEDGHKALLTLEKENISPDLILLDILMPRMDGYTFLKKAKKNNLIKNTPVFILTNLVVTQEEKENGKALGIINYWIKSRHSPSEITQNIKEFLKTGASWLKTKS